ncbi:MAG TPA: hypothetical protein VIL25_07380 [Vicinamibacterales bacterium]
MTRWSIAIAAAVLLTIVLASTLVWLLLAEPVALATAADDPTLVELAVTVGRALLDGLRALVELL